MSEAQHLGRSFVLLIFMRPAFDGMCALNMRVLSNSGLDGLDVIESDVQD